MVAPQAARAAQRRLVELGQHVRPAASGSNSAVSLSVSPAQETVVVGERAIFLVSWPQHGGETVAWKLTKDGLPLTSNEASTGSATLDATGSVHITGQLDEPGCLRCEVHSTGNAVALGGVAVSPFEILPSRPPPSDFDAFWAAKKAVLADTPANVQLRPIHTVDASGNYTAAGTGDQLRPEERSAELTAEIDAFEVVARSSVGAGVSAYLARPSGAKPRSLPAILLVHGAGVYSSDLQSAMRWAAGGGPGVDRGPPALAMDMNAHGIANGKSEAFYQELAAGELADYRIRGREDRDTCYFLAMLLRLVRGIDVLCAQPEWDGRTVAVYGVSQGGLQAIAAAGLDADRVTFFAAGVPAGCDHTGHLAASPRTCGWPQIAREPRADVDQAVVDKAVAYFDCVNFASRASAPSQWSVGLIDVVCPPTSVFAAYNALPSSAEKAIHVDAWAGHQHTAGADEAMRTAVIEHFRAMGHRPCQGD